MVVSLDVTKKDWLDPLGVNGVCGLWVREPEEEEKGRERRAMGDTAERGRMREGRGRGWEQRGGRTKVVAREG